MLKGISPVISPDLLKILMEMGHGDTLVIADANFPAASNARRLVRCDGASSLDVLDGIMQLFPLDDFEPCPAALMAVVPGDDFHPALWPKFRAILREHDRWEGEFEMIERKQFYERARLAYAIVATGEQERYANIILRKGIIEKSPAGS